MSTAWKRRKSTGSGALGQAAPKVLGVVLTTIPRATHAEEKKRVQKAVTRIRLISSLNLPLDRFRTKVKIFAIPIANYGREHRKVPKGIIQTINGAIAGGHRNTKRIEKNMRTAVVGGDTEFEVVTQATRTRIMKDLEKNDRIKEGKRNESDHSLAR